MFMISINVAILLLWRPCSAFLLPVKLRPFRKDAGPVMVMNPPSREPDFFRQLVRQSSSFSIPLGNGDYRGKKKFQRTRIPETEKEARLLLEQRQKRYEQILSNSQGNSPSIWSFESLFPEPIWDEVSVNRDLYEVKDRDRKQVKERAEKDRPNARSSFNGGTTLLGSWAEPKLTMDTLPMSNFTMAAAPLIAVDTRRNGRSETSAAATRSRTQSQVEGSSRIDRGMTRLVEDRLYGFQRAANGELSYATSLMGDGAVQFRDGVRLGNPLAINADRLNYLAKKELQKGRVEEAKELYERAIEIDPRDGRAYLGLSRCAERRRDFKLARACLQAGIANSKSPGDRGPNPFLLQALGVLEENMGYLSRAEELYIAAARSRPHHAAAWVSLAQLRTRKLGQSVAEGRVCFQTAERELKRAGLPVSAYVYTAWADLEYKKAGDLRRARELFKAALEADPKSSVAWLQLGVLETDSEDWKAAETCFENVLKFDQRNSRVLQAYALMETKKPEGNSRKAIGLFERALAANPRDAGVLQAYGLYVAELGDIDAARALLRRGTEVDKRHAAVWQAWGVLETRHGKPEEARKLFQQGIWSCAQLTGVQSGGHNCARLWQAWGVLEAKEGNHAAARRCFSRALDADSRNIATIIAWAHMEEELGEISDARVIYENALGKFAPGSNSKMSLWRNYETMEQRLGNQVAAQQVFQRAMRETFTIRDETGKDSPVSVKKSSDKLQPMDEVLKTSAEVEVVRWDGGGGEVWLNDNAIEGKLPYDLTERRNKK